MNKEEIKILEEYLEEARDENGFTDCEGLFEDKFFISLDKLLKRYKEERDLRIHFENRLDNMEQLYIDKDKVIEKIDELEEKRKHISEGSLDYQLRQYNYIGCKIDILKELLKEKE